MYKEITGQKFGKLTAIKLDHIQKKSNGTRHFWLCQCDCGKELIVEKYCLTSGHTKSCGCLKIGTPTHGLTKTRIYRTWCRMKERCYRVKNNRYQNYGGRGIKVCDEWKNDFMSFYNWAMAHGYTDNLTIDRINVNGNYEPNNCRWITTKAQNNNRKSNRFLTFNNETHTVAEWAEKVNIPVSVIYHRLYRKWSVEKALTTPKNEG